jgi:hypothetical protein
MIKILKAVYTLLRESPTVVGLVGDKIFPNVVSDKNDSSVNIDYPLIVTKRINIKPEYSKGCKVDEGLVEIVCYANSYSQVIDIAEAVREKLEFYAGTVDGIVISTTRLVQADEDYVENVYYQRLTFSFK